MLVIGDTVRHADARQRVRRPAVYARALRRYTAPTAAPLAPTAPIAPVGAPGGAGDWAAMRALLDEVETILRAELARQDATRNGVSHVPTVSTSSVEVR